MRPKRRIPAVPAALIALLLSILSGCAPRPVPPSPDVIESRIRSILELPVCEQVYRDIIYVGEEARFLGIRHIDTRLLFSIEIRVQAGIDLMKGVEVRPSAAGGAVVVLPEPELLLVDADESSIKEYFLKEFGKTIGRLEYYDEIERGKERVQAEAIDRGILVLAEQRTEAALTALFDRSVPGGVTVRFVSGEETP